jgi:2-polyprenyl-6-methoxyphenol hydroxylase-like FAD-dependent oxidoreductase
LPVPEQGRAEIVGAGFAGLTAATLLARSGWRVRVHERADAVREIGAGLFITHNGLVAMEGLGVLTELQPRGSQLSGALAVDRHGTVVGEDHLEGLSRTWVFPRQALIQSLHGAAIRAGAEVITGSEVAGVTSGGEVRLAAGETRRADLVIGADGFRSVCRRALGLERHAGELGTVSLRFLIPGREHLTQDITRQHWSGHHRVALTACSSQATYVYFACPAVDRPAWESERYLDVWRRRFPMLRGLFDTLDDHSPYVGRYGIVRCRRWSAGQVALIGDAAHALAPTLGQGTNLAMVNATSLVAFATRGEGAMSSRLQAWERACRGVTDASQRWSSAIDWATRYWPEWAEDTRRPVIAWLSGRGRGRFDVRAGSRVAPVTP